MRPFLLFLLSCFLLSCNNNNGNSKKPDTTITSEINSPDSLSPDTRITSEVRKKTQDGVEIETTAPEVSPVVFSGEYHKLEGDKTSLPCDCSCIDINFDSATEWCLEAGNIYMTAITKKTGTTTADVFFMAPARQESTSNSMPWEKFDTSAPVASIKFQADGSLEVDWLGFSIDNKIATQYALFGKKSLEGTYIKI